MTEKELRGMRRKDLLRLLIEEGEEAIRCQNDIEKKEMEIQELNDRVNALNSQIETMQDKMEQYDHLIEERDSRIKNTEQLMQQILLDSEVQVGKAERKLSEKEEIIKQMKADMDEKERQNWELANSIISKINI